MKLNEEELSIIPATPRYAKDHMDIYRNAEGYLDQFLDIDQDIKRYTFKNHNDWIQSYKREKEDHPTFFIKYWKKVVGLIMFREAYFMGGVQAVYFVHKKSASKGITSIALEQLVEVAFLTHKFLHVELHIDVLNVASQKVAELLGHSNPAITLSVYSHLYKGELAKSMGDVEQKIIQELIRVNTKTIKSETA